jgi:protein SCO1/2
MRAMNGRWRVAWLRGVRTLSLPRATLLLALLLAPVALAAYDGERDVAFEPHLGRQLSTTLMLRDAGGHRVALSQFLGRAPPVMVLGYLNCTDPCTRSTDAAADALGHAGLRADSDYLPLFVSIDPRDEAAPRALDGWHVLVGARAANELARAVGFRFYQDPQSGGFVHPHGFIVLTPEGRVSRYFIGTQFNPDDVAAAVHTAAQGQAPGLLERVLLFVFRQPVAARYSGAVLWLLQVALAFFAGYVLFHVWGRH